VSFPHSKIVSFSLNLVSTYRASSSVLYCPKYTFFPSIHGETCHLLRLDLYEIPPPPGDTLCFCVMKNHSICKMEEVTLPAPPEGFEYTIRKKSIISVKDSSELTARQLATGILKRMKSKK